MAADLPVWMALDLEELRVAMQPYEFDGHSFARGPRSATWPRLEGAVDSQAWDAYLAGELSQEEQDALHRQAWIAAGGDDVWTQPDDGGA